MKYALLALALMVPSFAGAAESELDQVMKLKGDSERGKIAYEICRGCHKADASGRAEAEYPQLAGQHASVLMKQMSDVRSGRRTTQKMHPFIAKDVVSTADIADIAAYLAKLPIPADNGKGDGKLLERGMALYKQDCAVCHGANGEGNAEKFIPRVSWQHYSYLLRENKSIQSTAGKRRDANPNMVKVIKRYSYKDLTAVSDYMSRMSSQ